MSYSKSFRSAVCAALCMLGASNAFATLFDRGGGLIYDSDLNITWLADANYAQNSGYDADGLMTWAAANAWATGLSYAGYSDWRLPTTLQPDATCVAQSGGDSYGHNCIGSEMGHLFYVELGVNYPNSILTSQNLLSLFQNVQAYPYWSGTEWAKDTAYGAWEFYAGQGTQSSWDKSYEFLAWAVHDGDVAAVPEPETYAMMLAGLGLLGFATRRKSTS